MDRTSQASTLQAQKRQTRLACIEQRERLHTGERRRRDTFVNDFLRRGFGERLAGAVVGFCWPYKGEPDIRMAIRDFRAFGARAALPEVVAKGHPLQFRHWWPGVTMEGRVYDIPVPQDTARLEPDVAFVPMNGFDDEGYRLGYGGGFFDRTLAATQPQPIAVGIAYEDARLDTILPCAHDVPMDFVVTESAIYANASGRLEAVPEHECRARFGALMRERELPRRQPESSA